MAVRWKPFSNCSINTYIHLNQSAHNYHDPSKDIQYVGKSLFHPLYAGVSIYGKTQLSNTVFSSASLLLNWGSFFYHKYGTLCYFCGQNQWHSQRGQSITFFRCLNISVTCLSPHSPAESCGCESSELSCSHEWPCRRGEEAVQGIHWPPLGMLLDTTGYPSSVQVMPFMDGNGGK